MNELAYYNEFDAYSAEWLRNLSGAGLIAPGVVDERSICDVVPTDLRGYQQCHFFAGIGIWSAALRAAGWLDDQPVWTGSCPCFTGDTLVLSERGYVRLDSLEIGDQVLTHLGRWRPVTAIGSRDGAETITVHAQGCPGIRTTREHPFYVRKQSRVGHFNRRHLGEPEWANAEFIQGHYCGQVLPSESESSYSREFWWVIGRYLADGWRVVPGGPSTAKRVYLCCARQEANEVAKRLIDGGFDFKRREERTATRFTINRDGLYEFLDQFGDKAYGKRVPRVVLELNNDKSTMFVEGYMSGDGHRCKHGNESTASTVSRSLALGMALVAQRAFGVVASVRLVPTKPTTTIEGRVVSQRDFYKLSIPDQNRSAVVDGRYGWKFVRRIEPSGVSRVFNISVDEDESYCADGAIVHNCQPFSGAGKREGFADERHLWPHWFWHIEHQRPNTIFGEQVTGADEWVDLVRTDLEGIGYTFGCVEIPSAGFGEANIRARTYWVAHLPGVGRRGRHYGNSPRLLGSVQTAGRSIVGGVEDTDGAGLERHAGNGGNQARRNKSHGSVTSSGNFGWLPDRLWPRGDPVEWVYCRDEKWRPIEPGTLPLAPSDSSTVGRLRAYGNAINLRTATEFISAYMECVGIRGKG